VTVLTSSSQAASCLDVAGRSYSTCPAALSEDVLVPPFFWRVPLDEAEERFASWEYGVYCGGNAWHLVQALTAEGFDAFTFNFAVDAEAGRPTHVLALVRVGAGLVALDPYYGHYLAEDVSGRPASFERHLDELRRLGSGSRGGSWVRLPGLGEKTLLLGDPKTIRPPGERWLRSGDVRIDSLHRDRLVLRHPPPPPWVDSLGSTPTAPGPAAGELGLLDPLSIADSSGQSLAFDAEEITAPAAVLQLAAELGFDSAVAGTRPQQA
jgi:hypothetical protein